jgi:CRP/FNR family cyclic AMP-dependent transcriptional regulator
MSLDGGTRSASVITLEPSVCSVVTRNSVRDHLAVEPDFAMELVTQVIRRARSADRDGAPDGLAGRVYGRVISTLESEEGPGRPDAPGAAGADHAPEHRQPRRAPRARWSAACSRTWKRAATSPWACKKITLLKKLPARW